MEIRKPSATGFESWAAALEERHLSDLTPSEVARALRALSSCYVERRARLAQGGALDSAGKRAAFALFYAPLHFLTTAHIVTALAPGRRLKEVLDLGCGTGSAGAAWALESGAPAITGFDRSAWAVAEANWTYRQLALRGRAVRQDLARVRLEPRADSGLLAAYAMNELPEAVRDLWLPRVIDAAHRGAAVLIIEPIARRLAPWWRVWEGAFLAAGGRADEWRIPATLPERQRQLARAAGLDPRELTARSLFADKISR